MDAILAVTVALVHGAFLAYVPLGGFAAWRWPRALIPHAVAVGWAVLNAGWHVPCPLTAWENSARLRAGWPPLHHGGFIDTYVEGVLYPARYTPLVLTAVAVTVLVSWAVAARGWAVRPGPGGRPVRPGREVSRG